MTAKPIYIYALRCPITNQIRYIGKSNQPQQRLYMHLFAAKKKYYKHHTCRWLQLLKRRNLEPVLEVLFRVPDSEDWREHERRYIAEAIAAGHKLTNQTAGGEGVTFLTESDFIKAKAARKAGFTDKVRQSKSASMKALWATPEHRAKMIRIMKETSSTPESRERLKKTSRAIPVESRKRQALTLRTTLAKRRTNTTDYRHHEIATRARLHRSSVSRFFRGEKISNEIYWKIVKALGVDLCPLVYRQMKLQYD